MNLVERMAAVRAGKTPPSEAADERQAAAEPVEPVPVTPTAPVAEPAPSAATTELKSEALGRLKDKVTETLYSGLAARLNDSSMTDAQLDALVRTELKSVLASETASMTQAERDRLADDVLADVTGLGPLEPLLADQNVTEIMVNGSDQIFVEHDGRVARTDARFRDEEHLRAVIERIVARVGRRIDESSPLVDARLSDGSRINAVIPPIAVRGSSLTIRKFSKEPLKVTDLIRFGSLTPEIARFLEACVRGRLNILISGGTGSGKTTLLNVLSAYIPDWERIVTVEDAIELQLQQEHVVQLESRPPNIEGRGEITIRDLVRNSLRMRPDRIVVGECRAGEALDMLQAMNTGHDGSLSTIHANSARDCLSRLETLVLMAGMDLPLRAIRERIASAVDLVVQIARLRDGTRRLVQLAEVQGLEGQTLVTQDIFLFDYEAGLDENGRFRGAPRPTGVRPGFSTRLADQGIELPADLFGEVVERRW